MKRKKVDLSFLLTKIFFNVRLISTSFILSLIVVSAAYFNSLSINKNKLKDIFSTNVNVQLYLVGDYIPRQYIQKFDLDTPYESGQVDILRHIRGQYVITKYMETKETFHRNESKLIESVKRENYKISKLQIIIPEMVKFKAAGNVFLNFTITKTAKYKVDAIKLEYKKYREEIKKLIENYLDEYVDPNRELVRYYFFKTNKIKKLKSRTQIYKLLSSIIFLTLLINVLYVFFQNRKILFKLSV